MVVITKIKTKALNTILVWYFKTCGEQYMYSQKSRIYWFKNKMDG